MIAGDHVIVYSAIHLLSFVSTKKIDCRIQGKSMRKRTMNTIASKFTPSIPRSDSREPFGLGRATFYYENDEEPSNQMVFSDTIKELDLHYYHDIKWISLPKHLEKLYIHTVQGNTKNFDFPNSLKSLTIGHLEEDIKDLNLPNLLKSLSIMYPKGDIKDLNLPKSLKSLALMHDFNQDIKNANFPDTLEYLTVGDQFDQDIKDANFPKSLKILTVGTHFQQNLTTHHCNFPEGLRIVKKLDYYN
jgi:hypothetical protein